MSGCCPVYDWCGATRPGHIEHDSGAYLRATRSEDRTVMVGAGTIVPDTPGSPLSVFVQITDDAADIDVDAQMTTTEAHLLIAALKLAISHAREAA